jgi:class 3 adenylate cyclase/tetratricopeptide (TPR) repeat protein
MHCPKCQHENREGARFCEACGSRLELLCPACGHQLRPGAAFCDQCGTSLTAQPSVPQTPDSRPQTLDPGLTSAERRQLTVMFCDLVGSTALSQQLDPEELREVVRAYQETCAAVIARFEGHLAKYLGDGLLVYFGYPAAHEDDAQRAVWAGLGILAELPQLNARVQPTLEAHSRAPLQIRIGIHTGLVVAGEMGGGDTREPLAIVGETPNIAARLQELAAPNSVALSDATYRLIQGYFECQALGPQSLKGVSLPLEVYRALGESGAHNRLEVAATIGLTPLVGREQEVGLLLERWEQAKEGRGQVALLSGEAGIGKSRLLQALHERTAGELLTWLECRCSPYHQNSAFYPVIDLLQRVFEFKREDSFEEKLRKLEVGALREAPLQPEVVPLFASLLSLPLPDRYPPLTLTPQRQKQKTQEAILAWLLALAAKQPLRFVMEDLHWADPSTLELLGLLIDQTPTAPILVLLSFRPDFRPPWALRSHLTQLTLNRLGRRQVEAMIESVAGNKALPAEVLQQVVAKTDGVPLFVEELTKMVLESGLHVGATHASPSLSAIPTTLHDSLMARLDRLGMAKEVAQLGATLGREFSYELLRAVSPLEETNLQNSLTALLQAELLYQRGLPPQATYIFKHALIQETAYQSLLKSTRQQYHKQIAQVLEEQFPETNETQPELLANHYTEAGLITQAINYWQKAGQRATQRSANVEAIAHLTKGLELLSTLPDMPERAQQELALQITLGAPLIATKGYSAPEVGKVYTRARELCRQVGETPQLVLVLDGLRVFYINQGELQTARELAEQIMRLAQSVQDPALLMKGHVVLGEVLYWIGEWAPARGHFERAIALYDPRWPRPPWAWIDDKVPSLSYAALALWMLGYSDQALKRSQEALTLAQELSHPFSLAWALHFAAWLHQCRREVQATQEQAEALIALSTEQGFPFWLAPGIRFRSWALAEQGQGEEGIAQIRLRQGRAAGRVTRASLGRSHSLASLAEVCGQVGQAEEGLVLLADALAVGERYYEAELYRLKGELTLKQSGVRSPESAVTNPQYPTPSPQAEAEAETCFQKAIEIARRQSAKSLELRAVMSLSRLWQQQGKKDEARQLLAEIYGWFTEGFDTADLKEAKALLEELA